MRSDEDAMTRSSPRAAASARPTSAEPSSSAHRFDQDRHEVDEVEVGDQRVGQLDEGPEPTTLLDYPWSLPEP